MNNKKNSVDKRIRTNFHNSSFFKVLLILEIFILCISIAGCFAKNKSFELAGEQFSVNSEIATEDNVTDQEVLHGITGVKSGAYDVTVYYHVSGEPESDITVKNIVGYVKLYSKENPTAIRMDQIKLRNIYQKATSRIWIRSGAGISDLNISIVQSGKNQICLEKIQFKEYRVYRFTRCIGWLSLFIIIDAAYMIFLGKGKSKISVNGKYIILGMALITVFASVPYFSNYLYSGDDLNFHLKRIAALAQAIGEGQIPHRIQHTLVNGYGYATPLYYGELLLVFPALLYFIGVPLQLSYQLFMIAVNLGTAVISYFCFYKISKDWKKGLFGSALYTCATYRLLDLWNRASVGEYCAMMFFPLLLYGFYHLYSMEDDEKYKITDCMPIVISLTGIIQSHILSCEMAAVFVFLFVILAIRKTIKKNRFWALLKSVIITVLLNLWFLYPFMKSMKMDVLVNAQEYSPIESRAYSIMQILGVASGTQYDNNLNHFQGAIGFSLLCGVVVFCCCCIKKEQWKLEKQKHFKVARYSILFAIIAIILSSNIFPWDNLYHFNKLIAQIATMVQFPWRYIGWAVLFLTLVAVLSMEFVEHTKSYRLSGILMVVILIGGVLTNGNFLLNSLKMETKSMNTVYDESSVDTGYLVSGEYLFENSWDVIANPICDSETGLDCSDVVWNKNEYSFSCINKMADEKKVSVPVLAYDNYHIYLEDGQELGYQKDYYGRIEIKIPGRYDGKIFIRYEEPISWRITEIVSLGVLLWSIVVCVWEKRRLR